MQSTAGATLHFYSLVALVVATSEMLNSAEVQTLLRTALIDAAAVQLDAALFSNSAETAGVSPAGLRYGLTPIVAAGATPSKAEAMADDLTKLVAALAPVSGSSPIALVCGAEQATSLQLRTGGKLTNPVFVTSALPAKTVLAVATQALVSASDAPRIDSSMHGVVHMDTVPAEIGGAGGVASISQSFFQTDSVSLRLRWPISWILRAANAVAVVSDVNW